jgi:hypothetical protein
VPLTELVLLRRRELVARGRAAVAGNHEAGVALLASLHMKLNVATGAPTFGAEASGQNGDRSAGRLSPLYLKANSLEERHVEDFAALVRRAPFPRPAHAGLSLRACAIWDLC